MKILWYQQQVSEVYENGRGKVVNNKQTSRLEAFRILVTKLWIFLLWYTNNQCLLAWRTEIWFCVASIFFIQLILNIHIFLSYQWSKRCLMGSFLSGLNFLWLFYSQILCYFILVDVKSSCQVFFIVYKFLLSKKKPELFLLSIYTLKLVGLFYHLHQLWQTSVQYPNQLGLMSSLFVKSLVLQMYFMKILHIQMN